MTFAIKRIAIIGAGPSGVTAAKFLLSAGFAHVDLYEQRNKTGGVWNYTPQIAKKLRKVPLVDPNVIEEPLYGGASAQRQNTKNNGTRTNGVKLSNGHSSTSNGVEHKDRTNCHLENGTLTIGEDKAHQNGDIEDGHVDSAQFDNVDLPVFISPMYDLLETNIPIELMAFHDRPLAEHLPLFPKHEDVNKYIQEYAEDVEHLVSFSTQVVDVHKEHDEWHVKSKSLITNNEMTRKYDAVVIGNGHYSIEYIPAVEGIQEWQERWPERIKHSKHYRKPEDYKDLKVVVVGNSASGTDIAHQIKTTCQLPLLQSCRRTNEFAIDDPDIQTCPQIVKFIPEDRAVQFQDGTIEKDIDQVLFCTGYLFSNPFLRDYIPSHINSSKGAIVTDGIRPHNLYQHIFYTHDPTLSFLSINFRIIPFTIAEVQSLVIANVWSNRLSLPSLSTRQQWEAKQIETNGSGRDMITLDYPKDVEYMEEMHGWCDTLKDDKKIARQATRWGKRQKEMRPMNRKIKVAYNKTREEKGVEVKTIEELGFDFSHERGSERGRADGRGWISSI